jgi:hypothetical protein
MPRFIAILLCAFAMLSLGVSPVAHAAEGAVCVESVSAEVSNTDRGQPDNDSADKNYPQQHMGCHAHHLAALTHEAGAPSQLMAGSLLPTIRAAALVAAPSAPALRPPQA